VKVIEGQGVEGQKKERRREPLGKKKKKGTYTTKKKKGYIGVIELLGIPEWAKEGQVSKKTWGVKNIDHGKKE